MKKFDPPKRKGPWQVTSTQILHRNDSGLVVRRDEVIRPDGEPDIYDTVEISNGVTILPLDNRGYIYLNNEYQYAAGRRSLEAVSGAIRMREYPIDAAKRELLEELGITAKKWNYLGIGHPLTGPIKTCTAFYLARVLEFSEPDRNPTKVRETVKISLEGAVEKALSGEIIDVNTISLLLIVNERSRRGLL